MFTENIALFHWDFNFYETDLSLVPCQLNISDSLGFWTKESPRIKNVK